MIKVTYLYKTHISNRKIKKNGYGEILKLLHVTFLTQGKGNAAVTPKGWGSPGMWQHTRLWGPAREATAWESPGQHEVDVSQHKNTLKHPQNVLIPIPSGRIHTNQELRSCWSHVLWNWFVLTATIDSSQTDSQLEAEEKHLKSAPFKQQCPPQLLFQVLKCAVEDLEVGFFPLNHENRWHLWWLSAQKFLLDSY